jgi:TonB family protein
LIDTLQLEEEKVEFHHEPRLLVEWTSRWQEFVTSLRPALGRSEARLAGEAPFGLIPLRIMGPSYFLEAFLIFAAIVIQPRLAAMRPYVAPRISSHDVIYYSGDELPRTEDLGGAQSGTTGRAGGQEAHHRTQTIKIARGGSLAARVVDAPNLRLPPTRDAVANLLAIQPNAGPPPVEGLRSSRSAPNLSGAIVAPAPDVTRNDTRDYTRNGIALTSVVPPAPHFSRDQPLIAPRLNPDVIPPAPNAGQRQTLVAPALGASIIPPAPSVSRDHALTAPSLNSTVVAPAPNASRDKTRAAPALAANVIPPAPGGVSREISSSPVQMSNVSVVPPPASAPERATSRISKVTLPSPSVIAPPPSQDMSQDMRRLASGSVPDPSRSVVPPPPTQSGSGSFVSSLIGKIFGASDVVPPPPSVESSSQRGNGTSSGTSVAPAVVPPPPSVANNSGGGNPRGTRNGSGAALGSNVIAPPPSAGISNAGARTLASAAAPAMGPASVVPPPPQLSGAGGGSGTTGGGAGAPRGTLLANNVVPPPPSLGGGAAATGSGSGRTGAGLGAPLNVSSPAAPPTSGGSGNAGSAVISSQPGPKVGLPSTGGAGSLAMSPSGNDKPGLGGGGGGTSIGHGDGTGSGMNGSATGAGKTGTEKGSDPAARGGISPSAGPGGAGNAPSGNPPVRGVDVSGGSTVVTLPSFGSDSPGSDPVAPGHSPAKAKPQVLGVTVVATASSGGAFEPYKNLIHGQTYTTYFDTSLGTVVMQFGEAAPINQPGGLSAPQSIRTDLPQGMPRVRMVVSCTVDASGNLKNIQVREAGTAEMTAKIVAALRGWKFQPAMRGAQPVEITAILGFNIDTNDRF